VVPHAYMMIRGSLADMHIVVDYVFARLKRQHTRATRVVIVLVSPQVLDANRCSPWQHGSIGGCVGACRNVASYVRS
jgi:hypothetical protein